MQNENIQISTVIPSISYLAGYFDGEGCVYLRDCNGARQLTAKIQSGDKETLDHFATQLALRCTFGSRGSARRVTKQELNLREELAKQIHAINSRETVWFS